MIKKSLFAFVFLLTALLAVQVVAATDIAYIVHNPGFPNNDLIDSINNLGYTYELIDDNDIDTTDFSDYEMILVWDEIIFNYQNIPVGEKKVLISNTRSSYIEEWGLADSTLFRISSGYEYGDILIDNTITKDLNNPVLLYNQSQIELYYLPNLPRLAIGLNKVVVKNDFNRNAIIGTILPGGRLYNNEEVSEKIVYFGLGYTDYWTDETRQMFKNSITWLIVGEDLDEDGYYEDVDCDDDDPEVNPGADEIAYDGIDQDCSGEDLRDVDEDGYDAIIVGGTDCDDNDPNLFHNIAAYMDEDDDGYGSGDLIQVCSSASLGPGYSLSGDDCDDNNYDINPSITEIAYDGIDQDCSGEDLRDVDEDGYDAIIVGGTDCDDDDPEINPGADEIAYDGIDQNCDSQDLTDVDEDGYDAIIVGGDDCDDNDPEINPGAEEIEHDGIDQNCDGYDLTDVDGDGYDGIVSGGEDCDDLDPDINPEGIEIAYDGIDQDCSGFDLADVDEDGYDAIIVGGTDCDDNDPEVNPGVEDVYKNCINDAPIIEPIEKVIVNEGEVVEIIVQAIDPEDDDLDYFINDVRFTNVDNVFTWETGYYDSGNYGFEIIINDGEFHVPVPVEVEVLDINQAPVCDFIFPQNWGEDGLYELDLNDYCSDLDGDDVEFEVEETSEENNIILDSLIQGIAIFSSQQDWVGSDWIIFKVSDGDDETLTNEISLSVTGVNDAPTLIQVIENILWDEDTDLIAFIDLNDYFEDIDSEVLDFEVSGNQDVDIVIENGVVSFYPDEDWYGIETITFTASDEDFSIDSNEVDLEVLDANEPPEFGDLVCESDILEDTEYTCELIATDFEDDEFSFSVIEQENVNCSIEESTLTYVSHENYVGEASCLIRVSDDYWYNDAFIGLVIQNVNDGPNIISFTPEEDYVKVLEGTNQLFDIVAEDLEDDEISFSWLLDDEEVGQEDDYLFEQESGTYSLKGIVSDGEENAEKVWEVFVGGIENFECNEVGGYVCSANQACLEGELLGVSDSDSCCSSACSQKPPEFNDIRDRLEISDEIDLVISSPDEDEEFEIGDNIKVNVEVRNYVQEDLEFDVEVFLYDISEDVVIESSQRSIDIDETRRGRLIFEVQIPHDIDENHNFVIFAKAVEEDETHYDEEYVEIDVERKEYYVIIDDLEIKSQKNIACGDYFNLRVRVENVGTEEDVVYLKIENRYLKISEETERFELKEYLEDDTETREFVFEIPESAKTGEYAIKASVFFNSTHTSKEVTLSLDECKEEEVEITPIQTKTISIENMATTPIVKPKPIVNPINTVLLSSIIILITLIAILYIFSSAKLYLSVLN